MDTFQPSERSRIMRRVKSENTRPELIVRRLVYRLGYRYRIHDASLPGKPDLVFKGRKKVIFVNGCFWHWHEGCRGARMPEANHAYWVSKIGRTVQRDKKNREELKAMGWETLDIWECQLNRLDELEKIIIGFLVGVAHDGSSYV